MFHLQEPATPAVCEFTSRSIGSALLIVRGMDGDKIELSRLDLMAVANVEMRIAAKWPIPRRWLPPLFRSQYVNAASRFDLDLFAFAEKASRIAYSSASIGTDQ